MVTRVIATDNCLHCVLSTILMELTAKEAPFADTIPEQILMNLLEVTADYVTEASRNNYNMANLGDCSLAMRRAANYMCDQIKSGNYKDGDNMDATYASIFGTPPN